MKWLHSVENKPRWPERYTAVGGYSYDAKLCEFYIQMMQEVSVFSTISVCKRVLPSVCIRQQIAPYAYLWFRPNNRMVRGHWLAIYTFRPPGNSGSPLLLSFHRSSSPLSFSLLNLTLKNSFLFTQASVHPQQKANTHPKSQSRLYLVQYEYPPLVLCLPESIERYSRSGKPMHTGGRTPSAVFKTVPNTETSGEKTKKVTQLYIQSNRTLWIILQNSHNYAY